MYKAKGKVCQSSMVNGDRFQGKNKKKGANGKDRKGSEQLPVNKGENRQKSVHFRKNKKNSTKKDKSRKHFTSTTQRSQGQLLNIPSFALGKDSFLQSPSKITSTYQDDYELTRTFFRPKKSQNLKNKQRKQSEQIETMAYQLANVNKIKMRKNKNKSLSKGHSVRGKSKKSKNKSQMKLLPKTSRNSQVSPQTKVKYLSPQVAKHQSSYCFESQEQPITQEHQQSEIQKQSSLPNLLLPPKRKSMLLFDSNGSLWRSITPHNLLRSTVDLLN